MQREQVVRLRNLGGRVPFERHARVGLRHPFAIVDDLHQRLAGIFDIDLDMRGARVNRILDQLFHHRGGALDDLASRNLVGYAVRE